MWKQRKRNLVVSNVYTFDGMMGKIFKIYLARQRKKIKFLVERKRKLGPIADEDLELKPHKDLQSLDPRKWKEQDHYAVLGLVHVRIRATANQIKSAYRKLVLQHHPDKRRRRGETVVDTDDSYFGCINKAFEVLGDETKRRAYDSVDPYFNNDVPPINKNSKENFFEVFTPVFDRNEQWSLKPDVPFLGDKDSSIEEVNNFYEFWYSFQSWREFSNLDEEQKESAEDACERRWMEKQNRAARAQRKKEENARMRLLVDNAYACDPRIKQFKADEKRKKEAIKAARAEAIRKEKERVKAEEEEVKRKEKEEADRVEEEMKKNKAEAKKKREREKKAMKKQRQKLQQFCKTYDYFHSEIDQRLVFMQDLEQLFTAIDFDTLSNLNNKIKETEDAQQGYQLICDQLSELQINESSDKKQNSEVKVEVVVKEKLVSNKREWNSADQEILVKASNLYPPGSVKRWQSVADYLNSHGASLKRDAKECLIEAKRMKENEMKAKVNEKAFEKFQEDHQIDQQKNQACPQGGDISQKFEEPKTPEEPRPWTTEEQKVLEQSLKTYNQTTPDRWNKIAESLPNRSKKECMMRFKELCERVKAKKKMIR